MRIVPPICKNGEAGRDPGAKGLVKMAMKPENWAAQVSQLRLLLGRLVRNLKTDESPETVGEIIDIVEKLEHALKSCSAAAAGGAPESSEPSRRRNKPKRYRVEQHGNAWCLAEHRAGGRQAYLCPQEVYDALVTEMSEIAEPVQFAALLQGVAGQIGKDVPDYLLRLCIRFWMGAKPALVEKIRTRYRPIRSATFARDARRAWRQLAQADDE